MDAFSGLDMRSLRRGKLKLKKKHAKPLRDCSYGMAWKVALIYWPPETVPGDFCRSNATHSSPTLSLKKHMPRTMTISAIIFHGTDLWFVGYTGDSQDAWHQHTVTYVPKERARKRYVLSGPFTFVSPTI
jgi:hypothetical protein